MPAAAAAEEDTLYVAMQQDVPDFNNYNLGSNSVWKANVIGYCYEGLVGTDYDRKPFALLATDWDFWEGNLTVRVYIRENVKFHDGTIMDAEDVVFSYLMARGGTTYSDRIIAAFDADNIGDPGFGVVTEAELLAGVVWVDDYIVDFKMAKQYGQFFTSTLSLPIVPKAIWENHVDVDNLVDVTWGTDTDALIGTGPYVYSEGVANSYRIIRTFSDYWGKDYFGAGKHWLTPAKMPSFPWVLDAVHYKIYASIDTAILALQAGDVDYIAWAVTAGRVPSLQSDPNIELEYMSDAGYRYLAFNMKKEPMNNLTFRRAVSHLIDKDQIVDVYMGGFGQAGSSAVPPFFGEWYDPTVTKYAFDIELAAQILDEAGYEDNNGDGWLELPDGRLMEKITLMTPPADYDPIRIRAGQMIATNMRAVGINCEAKPIDFNTLVAKLTAYDYQMLTLGWKFTGYTECVSLLFDIYSPIGGSNSWGWWSLANPSPYYADLGGVSTLADADTQAMADEFLALEQDARATFLVEEQIELTKQGQALVADADVCDILFYQVNVEAHNKVWTNWTIFDGQLINAFSWTTLIYSTGGGASGGGAVTTSVSTGLTLPGKVVSGDTVGATVMVIDNLGKPVANATVDVSVTGGGVVADPVTGTTDAGGVFTFDVTGTAVGQSTVTVNATMGTAKDSDQASIRTYTKGGIAVVVTPEKPSVVAGESIDVVCTVKDANGVVAGANVMIDKYLLGYGSISPEVGTTDANGQAVLVYTAPAEDLMNQHMLVTLSATVAKDGYLYSNVGAAGLVVYNDAAPDWYMVTVESVTTTALTDAANESTITVKLMDDAGTAIGSEALDVWYSDDTMLVSPVTTVTTAADGTADVAVQVKDLGVSGAVRVTVGMATTANSIPDSVTLTYEDSGSPPAAPMYGGYAVYAAPKFIDALGSVSVTFHVFDSAGVAADGITGSVLVAATDYGQMTDWSGAEYSTLWDLVGMVIMTEADGTSLASAGSYAAPEYLDEWVWDDVLEMWVALDIHGVDIVGGVYTMTIEGVGLAHLDQALNVFLCPDSTADFDWNTYNHMITGQTTITSGYGYGRGMDFVGTRYTIADPVLQARTTAFDETTIEAWVYDESNTLLAGAETYVYEASSLANSDYGLDPSTGRYTDPITTTATGYATWDIVCAAWNGSAYADVPAVTTPDLYVRADVAGAISLLSQTQLVIEPIVRVAFAAFEPVTVTQPIGFVATASAVVTDLAGDPIADLPVSISVSGGTAFNTEATTDADGMVTFAIDTSDSEDVRAAFIAAEVTTAGAYEASTARVMLAAVNDAPAVAVSAPGEDEEVVGGDVTVRGSAFDMNGLSALTMSVDGGSAIDLLDEDGASTVVISRLVEDLGEGEHTVAVVATDSLGVATESEVTFTVVGEESSMLAWIVAGIGWAVAVVLLVVLLMKMRKPAAPAAEAAPEEKA
jgi:ABC-type transport system substrate-binding protein